MQKVKQSFFVHTQHETKQIIGERWRAPYSQDRSSQDLKEWNKS